MRGFAIRIFVLEVVKAGFNDQFGHRQSARAIGPVNHRCGQLFAFDKRLGQQFAKFLPRSRSISGNRIAVIAFISDNRNPDRGAFIDRFQNIGPRQRIAIVKRFALNDPPARHRNAMRHKRLFGELFVNRHHRCRQPAMRIRHAHQIKHALHAAILARDPVQRVKHDIGLCLGNSGGHIAVHIDPRHRVPARFQSIGDTITAHQRHLALVRPAAHKDGDMELTQGCSFFAAHARPTL